MIRRAENRQFYTIVDGKTVNDTELSFEALGLLVRMLSMSDEWEFSIDGLAYQFNASRKTVARLVKELREKGYISIQFSKNKGGQFASCSWEVNEIRRMPQNGNTVNGNTAKGNAVNRMPKNGNTAGGNTVSGNTEKGHGITNINITNINKTNIKEINKKAYGEFLNVKLTEDEFVKLSTRLGPEETNGLIEELSCYLQNHPKKYKDHYATILTWARKRKQGIRFSRAAADGVRAKAEPLNPFDELLKKEGYT